MIRSSKNLAGFGGNAIVESVPYRLICSLQPLDTFFKRNTARTRRNVCRLEYLRHTMMVRFIRDCGEALDKRAPEVRTNFKGEEIREKFLLKLGDGKGIDGVRLFLSLADCSIELLQASWPYYLVVQILWGAGCSCVRVGQHFQVESRYGCTPNPSPNPNPQNLTLAPTLALATTRTPRRARKR